MVSKKNILDNKIQEILVYSVATVYITASVECYRLYIIIKQTTLPEVQTVLQTRLAKMFAIHFPRLYSAELLARGGRKNF